MLFKNLPLFVLPPAKPTYNDQIERSNRAVREEFYAELSEDTIVEAHHELMNFLQKCNIYHPTFRVGVYILYIIPEALCVSHLFEPKQNVSTFKNHLAWNG